MTLGSEAEELIARRQVTSMGDALILDSAASAAIENVCRNFEEDLSALEEFSDRFLTDRFSPGYGDLPLGVQKDFCEFLNARRRIGLTVTDSYLLVPQKSVTAVTGLSGKPQIRKFSGCESCAVKGRCVFRKRGETCRQLTEKQETDQ